MDPSKLTQSSLIHIYIHTQIAQGIGDVASGIDSFYLIFAGYVER
jgi:hypothetical protein